eukprot:scaffold17398_cov155-Skeletonema_marinoi.AAC.17
MASISLRHHTCNVPSQDVAIIILWLGSGGAVYGNTIVKRSDHLKAPPALYTKKEVTVCSWNFMRTHSIIFMIVTINNI